MQRNQLTIYIKTKSWNNLKIKVAPYFVESLKYKLK